MVCFKEKTSSCGYCSEPGHNIRTCPLVQGECSQTVEDVPLTAPQDSQNSEFAFMTTPGYNVSLSEPPACEPPTQLPSQAKKSAQQTSQANKPIQHKHAATKKTSKQAATPSNMTVDEDNIDDATGDGDDDEDPDLRPVVISEAWTMLQQRKLHQKPTGTRKISFKGDGTGINLPTNLPYSPKKVTWKGKAAVTSNQLIAKKEARVGKLKAKRAKTASK
uniref:Uncharacterized protein LOC104228217 n=1 Tax=Nicotiana sylvestris TaxID=4096 RepID=A0A1U7WNR8_NICSY|nr:PREDICTED: uncharacterized protein LOC104228217 [Nicotiana sylvestris]